MSKVLLTNAYFYPLDEKQWKTAQPYPPLATLYAAACIRQHNHSVTFIDQCLTKDLQIFHDTLAEGDFDVVVIYDDGFNYLTKMCLTVMRDAAFAMIKMAKEKGKTVIISSSDSTDHYQDYHDKGVDFVIHGEGEITLTELLKALNKGTYGQVSGISYLNDDLVCKNQIRSVLRDLDLLPMPAWDLLDVKPYREIWLKHHGYFALNIATTRGCPFKCNWCAKPIYGNRYNSRSPARVVQELAYLSEKFGVNYFWMCDDIFGLKPGWVQEFTRELESRKLAIKYKIQSRVDLLLKDDTIESLVKSGMDIAWVGAESGSQRILDAMDKGTTVEQIYQATSKVKKHGAKIAFFLQFGYLGEEKTDIDKTLRMLLDLMPDEVGISVSYPLPGTGFYEKVKGDLILKANWVDSDDLELMFKNRFSSSFYKRLQRYVHYRYRIKKGLISLRGMMVQPMKTNKTTLKQIASMVYNAPRAMLISILLARHE
jgi:anaerobic magnesium-protoporphyrin IX monomethyl ester cyclase